MAFNKNPTIETYKSHRFSFVGSPQARSGTTVGRDQRFVNLFPEMIKSKINDGKKYYLKERPGTIARVATAAGVGRGVYYWKGFVFSAVGNKLYKDSVVIQTLANSTGSVGFQQYNGTYDALIVLDGIAGYVIKTDFSVTTIQAPVWTTLTAYALADVVRPTVANGFEYEVTVAGTGAAGEPVWPLTVGGTIVSGTVTFTATLPAFPTPHCTSGAFLNGRFYVAKLNTADIYNCKLEDPLVWPADGFITAEMFPDTVVSLVRNNNYICAIGSDTIEFFYDAAIAIGSPLARQDAAVQQMGTPAASSVVQTDNDTIFVGQTGAGGRTVWAINGFKPIEIGTEAVRQSLDEEGTTLSTATAYCIRTMGHKFYALQLSTRTWVYDFDESMWHEWSDTTNDTTPFPYNYASDSTTGHPYVQHTTNGTVFELSPTVATDNSIPIYASATSVKIDFDSMDRKICARFTLVCDNPNPSGTTSCTLYWSDNDYQTWSTGRTILINGSMPFVNQLGQFRRRAFKLVYNQPYPLRLEGFEMDLNSGTQ